MYSTFSTAKIDGLRILYDSGYFDTTRLYELLEAFNNINQYEYRKANSNRWSFQTFSKNNGAFASKVYKHNIPNWKVLKKEYWNTEMNLLPTGMKQDFKEIDKFLADVTICKRIVQLSDFTSNPVQISFEESRAIKNVLDNKEKLGYYVFDYVV